jgi:hypothetical protein
MGHMSAPQPSRFRARSTEIALVALVFAWGLVQAFANLGAANLNADEPIYLSAGWAYVHGDFSSNREHPPTAKYLLGLAQLLLGEGELAGRVAVGVIVILGGAILYLWLRTEIAWPGALFAAGSWMILPHGVSSGVRLDRFAVLEPIMVFFSIAAFAAAWMWFRKRSWFWLVVSAVAMALSVTSKVSTAILLPALLLLPLLAKRVKDTLIGGAVFLVVFAVTCVVLYAPMGIRSALTYMLEMQSDHAAAGHSVVIAGVVYQHPPWWANLVLSVDGMGVVATLVLVLGAAAAFWRRPVGLTVYLAGGVALLLFFYVVVSSIALTHYYYSWVWFLCALAGVGLSMLLSRTGSRRVQVAKASVAAIMLIGAVAAGVWTTVAISHERPSGVALVIPELERLDATEGSILVGGLAQWEYIPYFDGRHTTTTTATTTGAGADIVAVAVKDSVRFPLSDEVQAFLAEHEDSLREITLDDVRLYVLEPRSP